MFWMFFCHNCGLIRTDKRKWLSEHKLTDVTRDILNRWPRWRLNHPQACYEIKNDGWWDIPLDSYQYRKNIISKIKRFYKLNFELSPWLR